MERPTIRTIDGVSHEMRQCDGRAFRIVSEFENDLPKYTEPDFIERHAAVIAEFYDGVTEDDILDMPLEEIIPASVAVRSFVIRNVWAKSAAIEKNAPEDEATER